DAIINFDLSPGKNKTLVITRVANIFYFIKRLIPFFTKLPVVVIVVAVIATATLVAPIISWPKAFPYRFTDIAHKFFTVTIHTMLDKRPAVKFQFAIGDR